MLDMYIIIISSNVLIVEKSLFMKKIDFITPEKNTRKKWNAVARKIRIKINSILCYIILVYVPTLQSAPGTLNAEIPRLLHFQAIVS